MLLPAAVVAPIFFKVSVFGRVSDVRMGGFRARLDLELLHKVNLLSVIFYLIFHWLFINSRQLQASVLSSID